MNDKGESFMFKVKIISSHNSRNKWINVFKDNSLPTPGTPECFLEGAEIPPGKKA